MMKWIWIFVLELVAIDQSLKHIARTRFKFGEYLSVIPNLLDVTYAENRGAAFGMLQNQQWFFILFAFSVIAILVYLIKFKKVNHNLFLTSATLLISGGIGNLIDRVCLGYVVDYMKFSFFTTVCNSADICIVAGTVLLSVYILFYHKSSKIRG